MQQRKDKNQKPKWLKTFDDKIMKITRQISQIKEEIRRVQHEKYAIKQKMDEERNYRQINLKELVTLKEKTVNKLRMMERERKR